MRSNLRGLDVSAVLDDRIQRLQRDLSAALDAVNATPEVLASRLTGGLRNEIVRMMRGVAADLVTPLGEGRLHPADAWARLHAKRTHADALLAECLSLVMGAEVRIPGPGRPADDGWRSSGSHLCEIADALIDELVARTPMSGWDSFTVLGTAESFDYASRLIVVRFPDPTIWDLVATAHELGHHAARTIAEFRDGRTRNLADELHDELDAAGTRWYWVEELLADAFATWVLGPAYGLTCVALAFDPLEANLNTESHPPGSARVGMIAAVLEAAGDDGARWLGRSLSSLWLRLVDISEAEARNGQTLVPDTWVERIVEVLSDRLPYSRYSTLTEAQRLASALADTQVRDTTSLADVMNAAWLARIQAPGRIGFHDVNLQCMAAARKIMKRGPDDNVRVSAEDGSPGPSS